jgi:hypothetical protein
MFTWIHSRLWLKRISVHLQTTEGDEGETVIFILIELYLVQKYLYILQKTTPESLASIVSTV